MFKKIREWLRLSSTPKTAEDLAARQEGKALRDEMETQRMGSLEGPPQFTHGGRESRGA